MARAWDIPKRYINLSLFDGRTGGIKSNKLLAFLSDDAKISFSTSATTALRSYEANVTITGLSRDTMGYLATAYTNWNSNAIKNRIVIDAGYDNNHSIVYDGQIIEAQPDLNSADFSISMKCAALYDSMTKNIQSISKEGEVSVKEIAEEIAGKISEDGDEVQVVYYPEKDYKVQDYSMSDASPYNQLRMLSKETGLDIYIENGRMYIKENGVAVNKLPELVIDSSNIIGSPMPDYMGCRVQIRMNPAVTGGMPARINSSRFELLNSYQYFVSEYHHVGETKGKKWFTEIVLLRNKIWQG